MDKSCFVVSPINSEGSEIRKNADRFYEDIVRKVCEDLGYIAVRGDKISHNKDINQVIIEHLLNDDLVIADLSGFNPNVFFEVGYRAATGKSMVLMRSKNDGLGDLPFDLRTMKVIYYSTDYTDVCAAQVDLSETIKNAEAGEAYLASPASDSLCKEEVDFIKGYISGILG